MPDSGTAPPSRADYTAEEWQVRVDLAASYRLINRFGLTDLIYNHITARVPGEDGAFLINPYGLRYDEVRASNLVKIDIDGNLLAPSDYAINPAGFTIHSAIHAARHDVFCIIHTHSDAGSAVSCLKDGFMPLTQAGFQFHDRLAYHDYEGIALDLDERERLVADFGNHHSMILRNHGLLATGTSIGEAFKRIYYLEQACRLQMSVLASGREIVQPPPEVMEKTARQFEGGGAGSVMKSGKPVSAWGAYLRLLDAEEPDYKT
jgi:ribulose-5-phosphate 4-epimerase/fuculose-1-phosphate aldolase